MTKTSKLILRAMPANDDHSAIVGYRVSYGSQSIKLLFITHRIPRGLTIGKKRSKKPYNSGRIEIVSLSHRGKTLLFSVSHDLSQGGTRVFYCEILEESSVRFFTSVVPVRLG